MNAKALILFTLSLWLCSCGVFSSSGPSSDYATNGLIGTAAGAGIGAAVGTVLENGDVANSAFLGAGVGLAVGVAGTYAYKKIKVHNQMVDNDQSIELNRREILSQQEELDGLRERAMEDSRGIDFDDSKSGKVYDGATLGVYYR